MFFLKETAVIRRKHVRLLLYSRCRQFASGRITKFSYSSKVFLYWNCSRKTFWSPEMWLLGASKNLNVFSWPPTRGSASGPRSGLCSQTPVIGSRSRARHARGSTPPKRDTLASPLRRRPVFCFRSRSFFLFLTNSFNQAFSEITQSNLYVYQNLREHWWGRYAGAMLLWAGHDSGCGRRITFPVSLTL